MTDLFPSLVVEIPGQVRNPLNQSWGHFKYSRWKQQWRCDVSTLVRAAVNRGNGRESIFRCRRRSCSRCMCDPDR